MPIRILWHGHSCFTLEQNGYSIVIDPYREVRGYAPLSLTANQVFCSHEHDDHNFVAAVKLLDTETKPPFAVHTVETDHDPEGGSLRGKNHVHIFRFDHLTIAHMGDLGHVPTKEQAEAIGKVDVVLIPVGGYYTVDAKQAMETVSLLAPSIVVPMHYRKDAWGYEVISTLEPFLALADREVVKYPTNELLIEKTKREIAVLAYLPEKE